MTPRFPDGQGSNTMWTSRIVDYCPSWPCGFDSVTRSGVNRRSEAVYSPRCTHRRKPLATLFAPCLAHG